METSLRLRATTGEPFALQLEAELSKCASLKKAMKGITWLHEGGYAAFWL